jgi:CRP-like cAMP-binding protein
MNETNDTTGTTLNEKHLKLLYQHQLFGDLNETELAIVLRHSKIFRAEKNRTLFREGDEGDYVCFVLDGEMDVMKESRTGLSVRIATLAEGDSIGEMSIIENTTRSAQVIVREPAVLVTLSKGEFDLLVEKYPVIGLKVIRQIARLLSRNLRETSKQLVRFMYPLY